MKTIKIFTRGKSVFGYIKLEIEQFIKSTDLDIRLEKVTDIHKISAENPARLPYLTMKGSDPIYIENGEYIHAFCNRIKSWIITANGIGSMTRILIPVDFSDTSLNAIAYALKRHKRSYTAIELISVQTEVISSLDGIPIVDKSNFELLKSKMSNLVSAYADNEEFSKLCVTGKVISGPIVSTILEESQNTPNTIIYIGSSGETGVLKNFFGSITRELVKKTTVPLFIIPPGYGNMGFTQIAMTVSDSTKDEAVIKDLFSLIGDYKPTLHLIHNEIDGQFFDFDDYKEPTSDFKSHLLKIKILSPGDTEDKIVDYINNNNFHLLVMSHYQRPFLESIFHRSIAKHVTPRINCPILILNTNSRTKAQLSGNISKGCGKCKSCTCETDNLIAIN